MAMLYVSADGATVRKEGERLRVSRDGETLQSVPLGHLDEAVVLDSVQVTTSALVAMLRRGAGLAILSHQGELLGRLESPLGRDGNLRVAQVRRLQDPAFVLARARETVIAKLENARQVVLRRIRDTHGDHTDDQAVTRALADAAQAASVADSLESLRGIEGAAARRYWAAFARQLPKGFPPFPGRRYRPSPDPANAALSLAYALLTSRVAAALEAVGLDPALGFFHGVHYGRPSLALDVMEPFRAPVVDRFVLRLFNLRRIGHDDYEPADGGAVRLRAEARSRYFGAWEEFVREHGVTAEVLRQAEAIRACFRGEADLWQPYRWRARA